MRTKLSVLLLINVVIVVLLSTVVALGQQGEVRTAIEAANKKFSEAVARGDAAAVAELYSTKAMILPPNSDVIEGREAIKNLFTGLISSGVKEITLTTIEVEGHGDTAIERGKYVVKDAGGAELDNGNFIVIWKRESAQWKLHRDIFNTTKR